MIEPTRRTSTSCAPRLRPCSPAMPLSMAGRRKRWREWRRTWASRRSGPPGLPGGQAEMIDAWFDSIDVAMAGGFPARADRGAEDPRTDPRTHPFSADRDPAAAGGLAPRAGDPGDAANALAGARLAWRSADRIWRLAGDKATDFNHYSKRTILIGFTAHQPRLPRRRQRRSGGNPRLFGSPHRGRHAL